MPRTDNKRAKQGRPKDPRPLIFAEQFTTKMPSGQQNVFIKPGPEIIDQPSRTSYGNMTPGPSGSLEILKGIVGGFNKGVENYNRVHQDRVKDDQEKANKILNQDYVRVTLADGSTDMVKKGGKRHTEYMEELSTGPSQTIKDITEGNDVASFEHRREKLQGLLGNMTKEGRQYTKAKLNDAGKTYKRDLDKLEANKLRIALASATEEIEREQILLEAEEAGYVLNGDTHMMIQMERANIDARQAQAAEDQAFDNTERDWTEYVAGLDPAERRKLDREDYIQYYVDSGALDSLVNIDPNNYRGVAELNEAREEALNKAKRLQAEIERRGNAFSNKQNNERAQERDRLEKLNEEEWNDRWSTATPEFKIENIDEYVKRKSLARERELGAGLSTDEKNNEKFDILQDLLENGIKDIRQFTSLAKDFGIDTIEGLSGAEAFELVARRGLERFGLGEQFEGEFEYTQEQFTNAGDRFIADIADREAKLRTFMNRRDKPNLYEVQAIQEEVGNIDGDKDAYAAAKAEGREAEFLSSLGFLGDPADFDGRLGNMLESEDFATFEKELGQLTAQNYEDSWNKQIKKKLKDDLAALNRGETPSGSLTFMDWLMTSNYKPSYLSASLSALDEDVDFIADFVEMDIEERQTALADRLEGKLATPDVDIPILTQTLGDALEAQRNKFNGDQDSARREFAAQQAAQQQEAENQKLRDEAGNNINRNGLDIFSYNNKLKDTNHMGRAKKTIYDKVMPDIFSRFWNALGNRQLPSALYNPTDPAGVVINTIVGSEGFQDALTAYASGDLTALGTYINGLELPAQDEASIVEVLDIMTWENYTDINGFTIKARKTRAGQLLQAQLHGMIIASEGREYAVDGADLTPFTYTFKLPQEVRSSVTSQILNNELDGLQIADGVDEAERNTLRTVTETAISIAREREMARIGDGPNKAAARAQAATVFNDSGYVQSTDFIKTLESLGMSRDGAVSAQLLYSIMPNFDETNLSRLKPNEREFITKFSSFLISPNQGGIFITKDPNYQDNEGAARNWFAQTMEKAAQEGIEVNSVDRLNMLIQWSMGKGDFIGQSLSGQENELYTEEELKEALLPHLPDGMAERDDLGEMAEFAFQTFNNAQPLQGINAFAILRSVQKMPGTKPFGTDAPPIGALMDMAFKPYDLPGERRYEAGTNRILTTFVPRAGTREVPFGGTMSYSASDALGSAAITDATQFIESYILNPINQQNYGSSGLTLAQQQGLMLSSKDLAAEIDRRSASGYPVDLLSATISAEMLMEEYAGRPSKLLDSIRAGAPSGFPMPESYLDFDGIGGLVYVRSGFGTDTAEENMAFRTKEGDRFFSIPDTNPMGEIAPNQQFIQIGNQTRVLTLGQMGMGDQDNISYIGENNATLPSQLAEVSHLVRDAKRGTEGIPFLGRNRYGFDTPLANMSEADQREVLERAEINYNNTVLETLGDLGYIRLNKDGVPAIEKDAIPASVLKANGVSIGNIPEDHLVGMDVAMAMIQQPLILRIEYLKHLLGAESSDMKAMIQQDTLDTAGIPRTASILETTIPSVGNFFMDRSSYELIDAPGRRDATGVLPTGQALKSQRLAPVYQPIDTVSFYEGSGLDSRDKGRLENVINPREYLFGLTGATKKAVGVASKAIGYAISPLATETNVAGSLSRYLKQLGRDKISAVPTRRLPFPSAFSLTPDNLFSIRVQTLDSNGNNVRNQAVLPPTPDYQRMGIGVLNEDQLDAIDFTSEALQRALQISSLGRVSIENEEDLRANLARFFRGGN